MTDYLSQLRKVMPPPTFPAEARGDWAAVEKELGTELPSDYKQFIGEYGSGVAFNCLWVFSPFSRKRSLAQNVVAIFDGYRIVLDEYPDLLPRPLFPQPGGILPMAQSDNADELHWVVRGWPSRWTLFMCNLSYLAFHDFGCTFVQFLHGVATGEIVCPLIPAECLEERPLYAPTKNYGAYDSVHDG